MKTVGILLVGFLGMAALYSQEDPRVYNPFTYPLGAYQEKLAQQLNNWGMEAYDKKNYPLAGALFTKAVLVEPKYAAAYYNLACVYALMRQQMQAPPPDPIYKAQIREALINAFIYDPKWRKKMITDSDFAWVKGEAFFKMLAMDPAEGPTQWLPFLGTFERPSQGIFPGDPQITFKPNGTAVVRQLIYPEDGYLQFGPDLSAQVSFQGDNFILKFQSGILKGQVWNGKVLYKKEPGIVEISGLEIYPREGEVWTLNYRKNEGGV